MTSRSSTLSILFNLSPHFVVYKSVEASGKMREKGKKERKKNLAGAKKTQKNWKNKKIHIRLKEKPERPEEMDEGKKKKKKKTQSVRSLALFTCAAHLIFSRTYVNLDSLRHAMSVRPSVIFYVRPSVILYAHPHTTSIVDYSALFSLCRVYLRLRI